MSAAKQVTTIDENEAMQPQPAAESVSVSARKVVRTRNLCALRGVACPMNG